MSELFSPTGALSLVSIGVILYVALRFFMKAKPRKEVLFVRPRDRRGETLAVTHETDRSLTCGKTNPIHRFIKLGAGYVFSEKGTAITRFWGIEGITYTADLTENPNFVAQRISEYLQALWGKAFYDKIPKEQKDAIEKDVIGVTVNPIPVAIEPNEDGTLSLPKLTSDDVNDEGDSVVLQRIAEGSKDKYNTKREIYQLLTGVVIGLGLMAIFLRLGWF